MRIYITILILSIFVLTVNAQEFVFHSENPFGITIMSDSESTLPFKIIFEDIDNDGDQDLLTFYVTVDDFVDIDVLSFDFQIYLLENIGSSQSPLFNEKTEIFSELELPRGMFLPSIADINGDGHFDIVANGEMDSYTHASQLVFFLNRGNGTFDRLTAEDFNLSEFPVESALQPELGDFDQDGDMDIMLSGIVPKEIGDDDPEGKVYYAKNIGSIGSPDFIGWFVNPYDIKDNAYHEIFISGDIDRDNDLDILSTFIDAESGGTKLLYRENQAGSDNRPIFTDPIESPFGLPVTSEDFNILNPLLVDIDDDGDQDFFCISGGSGIQSILYYENKVLSHLNDQLSESKIRITPNPATNNFSLENPGDFQIKKIELFNKHGELIQYFSPNLSGNYHFNKNIHGMYILVVETETGRFTQKIAVFN